MREKDRGDMGNIGYIFGYGLFFAFCFGGLLGYILGKCCN